MIVVGTGVRSTRVRSKHRTCLGSIPPLKVALLGDRRTRLRRTGAALPNPARRIPAAERVAAAVPVISAAVPRRAARPVVVVIAAAPRRAGRLRSATSIVISAFSRRIRRLRLAVVIVGLLWRRRRPLPPIRLWLVIPWVRILAARIRSRIKPFVSRLRRLVAVFSRPAPHITRRAVAAVRTTRASTLIARIRTPAISAARSRWTVSGRRRSCLSGSRVRPRLRSRGSRPCWTRRTRRG